MIIIQNKNEINRVKILKNNLGNVLPAGCDCPETKPLLQNKTFVFFENGTYNLTPDDDYKGISGGTIYAQILNAEQFYDINDENVNLNGSFSFGDNRYLTEEDFPNIKGFKTLKDGEKKFLNTYPYWNIYFPELTSGREMFGSYDLSAFTNNTEIHFGDRVPDFPKLTNGQRMFFGRTITEELPKMPLLENASRMFQNGIIKTPKILDFENTIYADVVFYNSTFDVDYEVNFPKLINGTSCFRDTKTTNNGRLLLNNSFSSLEKGNYMFYKTNLPIIIGDENIFPILENGQYMFRESIIDGDIVLDLPKLNMAPNMFYSTPYINSITLKNTKITGSTNAMFFNCKANTINFDLGQTTNCGSMFQNCTNLKEYICSTENNSNNVSIGSMFSNCTQIKKIEVHFNSCTASTASGVCKNCKNLQEIDMTIAGITDGTNMFAGNNLGNTMALKKVKIDAKNITKATAMFRYNSGLTDWYGDISNCTAGASIWQDCPELTNLDFFPNSIIQIGGCRPAYNTKLTRQSLLNIIEHLADLPEGTYKNIYFTQAQIDMLSEEEKEQITNKLWRINIV